MLTPQQLTQLKANILADPALANKPMNSDGDFEIAAAYNTIVTPTFWVWRTNLPVDEVMQNGFDWSRVDNLTVGKARIWDWMMRTAVLNPARSNVRAGILATFTAAGDDATRLAIFGHCQRPALRFEKLFATGPGTTTNNNGVGPATMPVGLPDTLGLVDIETARNLA